MFTRVLCVGLLWAALAYGQEPPRPSVRILEVSSSKDLSTPVFMRSGPPSCDADGNLYSHVSTNAQPANNPEVVRISLSTGDAQRYRVQEDGIAFATFSVSPEGDVAMAVEKPDGAYVYTFDSKGNPGHGVKLDIPSATFKPRQLGVFFDGSIFVAGYYGEGSSPELAGKGLTAIFEPSGKLRKRFGSAAMNVDMATLGDAPMDGGITMGPDHNLYLMQSDKILVVSSYGEIVKTIKFKKPDPDMYARNIAVRDGLISLEFAKTDPETHRLTAKYLLLTSDGNPKFVFEVSKQLINVAVCFDAANGYIFLRHNSGHLRVEYASIK